MKSSVCFVCLYCCLPSKKEELTTISLIVSLLCLFAQCHYLNDIGKSIRSHLKSFMAEQNIRIMCGLYSGIVQELMKAQQNGVLDLLIADHEEALRLSGSKDIPSAISFFAEKGAGAVLVTNGARDVYLWADSPLFGKVPMQTLPVSAAVGKALKEGRKGDSTGCGDNFAGGVIASIAKQLSHVSPLSRRGVGGEALNSQFSILNSQLSTLNSPLSLVESTKWGIVSGGFACFYYGGTYIEKKEGEKLTLLQELYDQY